MFAHKQSDQPASKAASPVQHGQSGHVPFFQPKLTVNQPGDEHEQEADRVADQVMRSPSPTPIGGGSNPIVQRISFTTIPSSPTPWEGQRDSVQRSEMEEEEQVQRKEKPAPHFFGNEPIAFLPRRVTGEEGEKVQRQEEEEGQVQRKEKSASHFFGNEPIVVQRKCAACEGEEKVQRQEMEEEETLQTKPLMRKSAEGGGYTASPQLTSQLTSSKGGGDPLPGKTLASMNQAFDADFSTVRIHTGSQAEEMSQSIQANAFTHGSDIYFNTGKYDTNTPQGNKLLAHELTHTIQQSGNKKNISAQKHENPILNTEVSGASEFIQRDIGLEFQANNVISKDKGKTKFKRLPTKEQPLKKKGDVELQVDTGSVMEFQTGHYKTWSDLKKDLDAVMGIISEIKSLKQQALNPGKVVDPKANPLVYSGFQTDKNGKVDITVEAGDFWGKPQSNEEIALSEFDSMLKENDSTRHTTVLGKTHGVFGTAKRTPELENFVEIIIYHLILLQRSGPDFIISNGKIKQPKAFLRLMNKVDYTAMYQFLSQNDQNEFQKLVNADPNPIATAAGVSMTDDLFKVGYWGWHPDRSENRILIKQGKIAMIQKEIKGVEGMGANKDIHKCGDKGVPKRYCKTKKSIKQVTVGAWLKSMVVPAKSSKKSITAPLPTYSKSEKAGYSWGLKNVTAPGQFLFEMRGHKGMPIADWLDFAENNFNYAATCRPGSKLKYDGKKPKPTTC